MRKLAVVLVLVAIGAVVAAQRGWFERARDRMFPKAPRLSAGDFPAGVSAPVDDVAAVPLRPTVIGVVPRGSIAPIVWAGSDGGLFKTGFALDVKVEVFQSETELRRALIRGAENGGVDLAAMSVAQLALSAQALRDAAPRTVLLLGRSRGHDVLAAVPPVDSLQAIKGKRVAYERGSTAHYFLLWALSRVGLSQTDFQKVLLDSTAEAAQTLRDKKADVAVGWAAALEPVAKEMGGSILTSTADAPHLVATVLVARGDFAAHYPDAIRRVLRGVLEAGAQVSRDTTAASRVLGDVAPELGDPNESIRLAPPATVRDNLAFFGLVGEAPVTYSELFESASALGTRLENAPKGPAAEDTVDLGALKYVSGPRTPN